MHPYVRTSRLTSKVAAAIAVLAMSAGSVLFAPQAYAAALTSTNVQPASLVAGASSTVTVSFTTVGTIPLDGKIKVTFPSGFNVASASGAACPSMDGTLATSVAGQVVTITRSAGSAQTAAAESCTINNIVNPQVSGSTGTYTIETTSSTDVQVDIDAAVTADTITAAALTSTNVQPNSVRVGTTNLVTVSFTTVNPIPSDGKIKVTFPSGFTVSGASGGTCTTMDGTITTGVAGQVVTLTRSGGANQIAAAESCTINGVINPTTAGTTGTYTIATTNTSDAEIDVLSTVTGDTLYAAESSAPSSSTAQSYDLSLSSPTNEDVFSAGDSLEIEWISSSNISIVDLFYSIDGGVTWTTIADNLANSQSYVWTVPELGQFESMSIKVAGTDLVTTLASAMTDEFEVWSDLESENESEEEAVEADDEDESDESEDAVPAGYGYSPVTGELEMIDEVEVGDYISGESFDTVYYIDAGLVRRPFMNAQTFFTYEDSFSAVMEVTDATLSSLTLSVPMLPKAGVVLVKIESDANVYALEMDGNDTELRLISSESVAVALYGADWADYVIDVPSTLFTRFEMGSSITSAASVDLDDMKKRVDLR